MVPRLCPQIAGVPFQGVELGVGGTSEMKAKQIEFSFLGNQSISFFHLFHLLRLLVEYHLRKGLIYLMIFAKHWTSPLSFLVSVV